HYARWDAASGECLVRVAAYNKDSQIKNSWLFGVAGNDQPAEVWKNAGSSFTCGKDIFGFGLMTKTKTTAVVGVGGGTLVGAGVGALAGHGERRFDCDVKANRDKLSQELRESGGISRLDKYIDIDMSNISNETIGKSECKDIADLYDRYKKMESFGPKGECQNVTFVIGNFKKLETAAAEGNSVNAYDWLKYYVNGSEKPIFLDEVKIVLTDEDKNKLVDGRQVKKENTDCQKYSSLLKDGYADGIMCNGVDNTNCLPGGIIVEKQLTELKEVFKKLPSVSEVEESNMLASTAIGAGTGAAAGGLATAITAFVEKNNINCRVGDGLQKVDYGKSYSIGSLKDFYVKWNLRLPDTIMPTATATDCASWTKACETLKDLNQCTIAQVNYKPVNSMNTTLVNTACAVSGSTCTVNYPVAVSNGACQ
ncbi:MAG TPA: hypothetical protein PLZ05_02760, partial [Alphaproteobacteria bacterium]|nr:hypothetical protein [Alphaproteobacteria bacterium]